MSRGDAEGAVFISSCTLVQFLSALGFLRKQREVGSRGNRKGKPESSCRKTG